MEKESTKIPKWLDNLILTLKPENIRKYWPYYLLAILVASCPFIVQFVLEAKNCDPASDFLIFYDCTLNSQ